MSDNVNIDLVSRTNGKLMGGGDVAMRLLANNFNANALRTNDTLRKDEWKVYDTALIAVARSRLNGIADLMSRGLTFSLPNALGITRVEWETATELTGADITMSGISQSQNDRMEFDLSGIPVPIIHKDFNLNIRALEASRRTGQPLDTMQVERATRRVVEAAESMLFNGYTGLGSNNTIYGYQNAANRNTGTSTGSHDWDTDSTGSEMLTDVLSMIDKLVADNMYGPYGLYVTNTAFVRMGDDFKTNSDKSILQRLLEVPNLEFIKPSPYVGAKQQVMVQLTRDVVDMIDGIQPMMVEWDSHGGFVKNFKVLAIMVPRVRNDAELQSGIAHFTGA
ncbi:MAG: hypothetical protein E6Q97_36485 [Desulfurellales bacterium]|nr:MAG: hypothetical protein E6Q97_36485 [Desulfurellales bacterium]